ncbi:hypothetical protein B9W62_30610 [Streptomyces sp. CS113]|uniref:hypothetical protein n=1 Tax=Streptomyces sp. CS113 TaxID=1982761 RepID=UPI000B408CA0|nr:hypothetical protein [Streptomyces sp. CS113]OWA02885.1 hypothetical protein B9W62_30610 [Streptomyces sp. CS113]
MILFVLSVILVLVVAGCACVVWAARGGPPWTRVVAKATMAAGELVRASGRSTGNRNRSGDSTTLGGD